MLNRITQYAKHLYRFHVKRDPFVRGVRRWFQDKGDETLRLEYPLDANSVVVDVGGYRGDFADAIYKRFGCSVIVFEPVPAFYSQCVQRFSGNDKISVFNCGLGTIDGSLPIRIDNDASSFYRLTPFAQVQVVQLSKADSMLSKLGLNQIDLMKINIEGGEYELLPLLIESGWIKRIRYVQVQFHNFVPEAAARRNAIRAKLSETHHIMWNYEFVWESWCLGK